MAENTGNSEKPLSEYSIPINELLESGIPEVIAFGHRYVRKNVFGLPSPPQPPKSVLSISEMLDSQESGVSCSPKRQRESFTPEISDDEERRMHASFLLNLASPEANPRANTVCETSPPPDMARKKHKSRYADTISQPLVRLIRPPYEFMNGSGTQSEEGGLSYRYGVLQSPPQSPPEVNQPRQRARPGRCARKAQGCNENTKFRPVISDWTCYKNYEPCPKDSQVGWCNKCWCNKGHYSEEDFHLRKFDLLEDQIMVWAEEFHVNKFEVWLPNRDSSPASSSHKIIVDRVAARIYILRWREEWERTRILPNIKIRPV